MWGSGARAALLRALVAAEIFPGGAGRPLRVAARELQDRGGPRQPLTIGREAFSELHGNPLRAWFRVFDPEQLGPESCSKKKKWQGPADHLPTLQGAAGACAEGHGG